MIDLHIHPTCSDGQFSPEETIRMAHQAGVTVAAVTDHDTVSGIVAASAAAVACGMTFFPGIEISVQGGMELHILGYGVHPDSDVLHQFCAKHAADRTERCGKMLAYLQKKAQPLRWKMCAAATRGKPPGDRISPERW